MELQIDTQGWDRWSEVVSYQNSRGISIEQAIEELVNKGLSNE